MILHLLLIHQFQRRNVFLVDGRGLENRKKLNIGYLAEMLLAQKTLI